MFHNSKLYEVDFTECIIGTKTFDNCDLLNAIFKSTNLQNTDLKSSLNFIIDPENNHIKGAKFSLESIKDLITKYNIIIE